MINPWFQSLHQNPDGLEMREQTISDEKLQNLVFLLQNFWLDFIHQVLHRQFGHLNTSGAKNIFNLVTRLNVDCPKPSTCTFFIDLSRY